MKNFLLFSKVIARFIYFFLKLLPTQNKVVLISRFNKTTSIDFKLIEEEIKQVSPNTSIKILNHKLRNKFLLICDVLIEMYHLATSKAAIIDSYVIPVSILNHKKNLIIIQIWHALGAIKKFGHASLNTKEGASTKTAQIMDMHKNYTYVISNSPQTAKFYAKAFNVEKNKIKNYGMPRLDYLINNEIKNKIKKEIYKTYPILKNKINILYVPTFRKNKTIPYDKLIEKIDLNKYNLIIKKHINDKSKIKTNKNIIIDTKFDTTNILFIADYVITDYSALAFEAAFLDIPVHFWVYDFEKYIKRRGLFINVNEKNMPGVISKKIDEIISSIQKNEYDFSRLKKFKEKYVVNSNGKSTEQIVKLIISKGGNYDKKN